ncbi:unnamed protein product [Urochloa humidicola]
MEGDLGWFCSSGSNNWDLHAVVRFACSGGGRVAPPPAANDTFSWLHTPSATEESSSGLPPPPPQTGHPVNAAAAAASQPLQADPAVDDLCLQAFFASPKLETPPQPASPTNQAPPSKPRSSGRAGGGGPTRSKRKSKKNQVSKEVTRVPVGGPPADLWAWRKYGQKPIKGSPYPRGYYRCSTDKDCKARKQVERCRDDPGTLIVTYTGEHSHPVPLHRYSLAGTTRTKAQPPLPPSSPAAAAEETAAMSASATDTATKSPLGSPSASTGTGLSPSTPLCSPSLGVEYKDEEEDHDGVAAGLLLEDMVGADDVLLYLMSEETTAPAGPVHGSGCDDAMLFPKPEEAQPTTSAGRTDGGGAEAAPVMNIGDAEEMFSTSSLSAWEAATAAATSNWG